MFSSLAIARRCLISCCFALGCRANLTLVSLVESHLPLPDTAHTSPAAANNCVSDDGYTIPNKTGDELVIKPAGKDFVTTYVEMHWRDHVSSNS